MDGMSVEHALSFTYDLAGQLKTASDPAATYTFDYDGLGRADEIIHDLAALTPDVAFTQTFDKVGNRIGLRALIGTTDDFNTRFYYDDLYRMIKITQGEDQTGLVETPKEILLEYVLSRRLSETGSLGLFETEPRSSIGKATSWGDVERGKEKGTSLSLRP